MICDECKETVHTLKHIKSDYWICDHCNGFEVVNAPLMVGTEYYKWYPKGNVSRARINMVKSRCISPDDGRTVVMRNHAGRITDRRGYNF